MAMRIAELREAAGLTRREFADNMGVTEDNVVLWERERSPIYPLARELPRMARVLGCTIDDLYDDAELTSSHNETKCPMS